MDLLADESVERQIVEALRGAGHDVVSIAESGPGMPDDEVLALSTRNRAVLVTLDTDFGELVYRQRLASHGVLLVRLPGEPPDRKTALVVETVDRHADELTGAFSVLNANQLRIRSV